MADASASYANLPIDRSHANFAAACIADVTPSTSGALAAATNWAEQMEAAESGEDSFTVVKNKRRCRESPNRPVEQRFSGVAASRRTGATQRRRPTAGGATVVQEIRATRADIADARVQQRSSTEDNCVFVEHCPDFGYTHYLQAVEELIGGAGNVLQVMKMDSHMLVGLSTKALAERLLRDGLEIGHNHLRAFPFKKRAERVTVANLPFFVDDDAVIEALKPYEDVTSIAPIRLRAGRYTFTDGRREVFILLKEGFTLEKIPTRVVIRNKGNVLSAFISYGVKCSRCGRQGHRRANCPINPGRASNNGQPQPAPLPPGASSTVSRQQSRPTPAAPALPMEETPSAPPPVTPAPPLQAPEGPVGPRPAGSQHPEPPPARPDLVAPRGPLPAQKTLGPAAPTPDVEMSIMEETFASSTSSAKNATRVDLDAFIEGHPSVSFAETDALGLGREEVLDLLSSRTKVQRKGPLLSPPQCDALVGLIGHILDLRPGAASNLYKVFGQVKAELRTTPAVPPTPPLPAPQPAETAPPAPLGKESAPAEVTYPLPLPVKMTDEARKKWLLDLFKELNYKTFLLPLLGWIRPEQIIHAALHSGEERNDILSAHPNQRSILANFLGSIIERARGGKTSDDPNNYRPISLLCIPYKILERIILNRISPIIEEYLPIEQAGFRPGRNCAEQTLALTTTIEDGFQKKLKTGAVFVDLTAAYDTVWREGLLYKLSKIINCKNIIKLINNFLTNRKITVHLNNKKSRPRTLNNGLPQGSVLAPLLFNVYTADIPATNSQKFLYADDIALLHQEQSFSTLEQILNEDLKKLENFFSKWHLIPNPSKTVSSVFHLNNHKANRPLKLTFCNKPLSHDPCPKYLGVTLDRSLTFRQHLEKTRDKLKTRNNIMTRLAGTTWGCSADTLRTTALALVYSVAEYCAPVWERSSHTDSIDAQLNQTMRLITGNMRPTPIDWLPYLSNIAPPDLRRKKSTSNLLSKIKANTKLSINTALEIPPPTRLISRNPAWVADENVDLKEEWRNRWSNLAIANKDLVEDPNTKPPGYNLPRRTWSTLNRIRTSTGRCNYLLNKWNMSPDQNCDCGQIQTMHHILRDCPRRFFQGTLGDIHRCTEEALEHEGCCPTKPSEMLTVLPWCDVLINRIHTQLLYMLDRTSYQTVVRVTVLHFQIVILSLDLKIFTTSYKIPIAEEDKPKTAIITPFGLFEFNVMSFGLRNATATFQRFLHEVLRNLNFAFVYLDDILVASKTEEEHYSHLETLFSRLNSYGLRINISKSKFLVQEIDFLGYLITSHGVKPLPTKVKAILEYKKPKAFNELRLFLGMLNFYHTFFNNAAESQAILHEYLRGCSVQAEVQFEKCKQALANTALLAYPDAKLPISLCTDASDRAVGSVFQQLDNNIWKPITFFSKKLNPAQCNYSTYDRKLLAIYLSIKFFKHLVEAREFTILTDHKPLIYAFKQKNEKASPRQLRHLQYISQFTSDIKKWAQACVDCQKCKVSIHTKSEIGKYQEVDERFSVVHIDLIGPLPPSNGNIYCLTCIDRYTSWMEVVPLPDMKSETVARAFYENWVVRFGAPHTVISDQGKQFTSHLFKDLTTLCGIKLRHFTAYHPQCNRKIERLHRTIKTAIRAHNNIKWTETLPTVLLGLKTIRLPGKFFDDSKHQLDAEEFVQQLQKQMELLKPLNEKHHSKTKVFVHKDLKTCPHVFIRTDRVKKHLEQPYEGPFPVLYRTDKYFTLKVKGRNVTISIDRLPPAYLLADSDNLTSEHPLAARPIVSGALPSTSS
ncbi:hypothetical protein LAZ67_12000730 [Cordylochernes scorpioides]|uniref:Reverse transcriptase n=1 Tax=Cordylochernes scorpioides TaxID=51811 RepID=A0ABY6L5M7_9ARAC|nr:hypothetical protein LAZ67_12000730 [Cordylochernes scorpioides]